MSAAEGLDEEKAELPLSLHINPLMLFDIAKVQERPLYAAAPMVRYSKLAFRETVARYGVDLCWTPMIIAKEFNRNRLARDSDFTLSPTSPPTIAQFAANSPLELSRATTLIGPFVNGIDINCGCPQSWAYTETLGAALMHKRELVASMITAAKTALRDNGFEGKKTVSVKIRIHKDLRDTVDFVKTVEAAGADFITIHGRLRNTLSSVPVDLKAVKLVAKQTTVPTLENGDVFTLGDAWDHYHDTGVQGVMAARALLQNPALFRGNPSCPWEAVETFMDRVVRAPIPFKLVVHHLGEMCGSDPSRFGAEEGGGTLLNKEERMRLHGCRNMLELMDLLDDIRELRRLS